MSNNNTTDDQTATAPPVRSSALLADAVRGLMQLMDDGDLVRNIEHDADFMAFTRQGIRITNALRAARNALNAEASANIVLADKTSVLPANEKPI